MNELVKMVLVLVLVTGISTVLLSFAHSLTQPLIARSRNSTMLPQIQEIFPGADSTENSDGVVQVYQDGKRIGKVSVAEAKGYRSTITVLVGLDEQGVVKGVSVLSQEETPGLGTRVAEPSFLDQFKSKPVEKIALSSEGGEIDAVTGATISSRAVTQAVRTTVERLR